jgi:hypothetical protein
LSIFEAVISTLEGKLQRIDNLDKAVEHMMRRVESLDHKVADNILKTDAIITRLGDLTQNSRTMIYLRLRDHRLGLG